MNETSSKKQLLIFDLDGTLCDTLPVLTKSINMTQAELGLPLCDTEHVRRSIGNGARMLCRRCLPSFSYDDAELLDIFCEKYSQNYARVYLESTEALYDGIEQAISELSKRGYTLAVFSNKPDRFTVSLVCESLGGEHFALLRGAIDGQPTKPDARSLLNICDELGFSPSDTVMIGDSEPDIGASVAARTELVAVSWGFRTREELLRAGAQLIIDHPLQLLDLFK